MGTLPDIWLVLKIMFLSTLGTVGILLPIVALGVVFTIIIRKLCRK